MIAAWLLLGVLGLILGLVLVVWGRRASKRSRQTVGWLVISLAVGLILVAGLTGFIISRAL